MRRVSWEQSDEETIVIAARAGDLAAFDQLARKYRPALVTIARQLLRGECAEDAAQDTLLAAFKALPRLQDPKRFSAWLGSIIRHRSRRLGRQAKPFVPLDQVILSYAPSIVERLQEDERSERIGKAIEGLPEELRNAAGLHYLQDWTTAQIAEFLGLPL